MKDIVYFELNHWSDSFYPPVEPFESWMSDYYETPEEEVKSWIRPAEIMDKWFKDNKICVVESNIDMSLNFCITAPRKWVEENCPELFNYPKFLREPDEDGDVTGSWGGHFVEWTEDNFGLWYDIEKEDNMGFDYYELIKWEEEE